ncbi:hypothetical protein ABZ916_16320 [Streptomyces sp. NPDC046853]|uniref:hypothetical protein n=1 Tax=Streptomyces sp. NPDC046853 TaxID=3154920 RepID=UPI0034048B21
MTNWPQLSHAYGPAADLPAQLERLASAPTPESWNDLWSALCHQSSVYPASFAALPWLAGVAGGQDREQAGNALALAGAIMAGVDQPHGAGDVRAEHAADIAVLASLADARLRTAEDPAEYAYLLEAVLSFEGVAGWRETLAQGLMNEEYEVTCPQCAAELFLVLGEPGFFSCTGDYALSDDTTVVETRPLRPANPADLTGIGRRLHDLARTDEQQTVARALTHLFGQATCPACETSFSVEARVNAGTTGFASGRGSAAEPDHAPATAVGFRDHLGPAPEELGE